MGKGNIKLIRFIHQTNVGRVLGGCPRIENLLRKSWFWPDFPIFFVKEPAIRLKKSKNLTQNSFPSLRLLFSDRLLGLRGGTYLASILVNNKTLKLANSWLCNYFRAQSIGKNQPLKFCSRDHLEYNNNLTIIAD